MQAWWHRTVFVATHQSQFYDVEINRLRTWWRYTYSTVHRVSAVTHQIPLKDFYSWTGSDDDVMCTVRSVWFNVFLMATSPTDPAQPDARKSAVDRSLCRFLSGAFFFYFIHLFSFIYFWGKGWIMFMTPFVCVSFVCLFACLFVLCVCVWSFVCFCFVCLFLLVAAESLERIAAQRFVV